MPGGVELKDARTACTRQVAAGPRRLIYMRCDVSKSRYVSQDRRHWWLAALFRQIKHNLGALFSARAEPLGTSHSCAATGNPQMAVGIAITVYHAEDVSRDIDIGAGLRKGKER